MATQTFSNSQFLKQHFGCFGFEVDKAKETYPVTGKMHVEIPKDVTTEELKEIENALAKTIAAELNCNPEQIEVMVDPETGVATFVVKTNNPTLAEEMQKVLKTTDFVEHVNKGIGENCENLPARIADNLAINDMNVTFFVPKPQTDKQFQNFHFSLSLKI